MKLYIKTTPVGFMIDKIFLPTGNLASNYHLKFLPLICQLFAN